MAQKIIDLSGSGGLTKGFHGDLDTLTERPELSINVKEGELALGLFNPYLRKGYLSPTVTTTIPITSTPTQASFFKSVKYDNVNNDVFWAETGAGDASSLYKGDGLSDTELEQIFTLEDGENIQDLEIYTIKNKRYLFYLYKTQEQIKTKQLSESAKWDNMAVRIPYVGYKTEIITSDYKFGNLPATYSKTFSIPAGSNISVGVWIASYGSITSVTADGSALTKVEETSRQDGTGTRYDTFFYKRFGSTVPADDKEIIITKSGTSLCAVHYVFFENAASTPVVNSTKGFGSTLITQLDIGFGQSTSSNNSMNLNFSVIEIDRFNISTAVADDFFETGAQNTAGNGGSVYIKPDGTKMYIDGDTGTFRRIFQYTLSTAWDISTAVYDSVYLDYTSSFDEAASRIRFNSTGTSLILSDSASFSEKKLFKYALSTAWDVSSVSSYNTVTYTPPDGVSYYAFDISEDGNHVYVSNHISGSDRGEILHYTTPAPFSFDGTLTLVDRYPIPFYIESLTLFAEDTQIAVCELNESTYYVYKFDPLKPYEVAYLDETDISVTLADDTNYGIFIPHAGGRLFYRSGSSADVRSSSLTSGSLPSISSEGSVITGQDEYAFTSKLFLEDNAFSIDIGVTQLPLTSTHNHTWLSETLDVLISSDSDYNFMRLADNGFMYLFTQNKVHKIDGGITGGDNGYITSPVLVLPDYFRIVDAIDYRSRLYMAVSQYPIAQYEEGYVYTNIPMYDTFTGSCGILVWDRLSTKVDGIDYIELPGVKQIKKIYASPDGVLKILVISDSGLTELRQFGYNDSGGVVFPVQATLNIGAYPNVPDSLVTAGDKSLWIANDGRIYSEIGNKISILHEIITPTATSSRETGLTVGAINFGSSSETTSSGFKSYKQAFTFSYRDNTTNLVTTERFYPFDLDNSLYGAPSIHQGDVYTGVTLLPITSILRNVRVYNAPITGSGTDVIATVKLYFNQGTTSVLPNGMTKTITKDEAKRGYVDFKINKSNVNAVQIEIEWNSSTTLGADTYLPSLAVVSYDETTTQSPDNG